MNKYFIPLMAFAMIFFCGCGDDDPVKPSQNYVNGNGGNNSGDDDGDDEDDDDDDDIDVNPDAPLPGADALSPDEQQQKMTEVGKKALSYVSALDFTYWRQLYDHLDETFVDNEDYDNDVVEDFFENLIESSNVADGHHQENKTEHSYPYIYHYTYNYTDYKNLILLSNITGHFTAGPNRWSKREADDLQFIFEDQNGSRCVAKLTTSGKKKTIHLVDIEDEEDYSWYSDGYNTYSTSYINNDKYYVEVPEQINVTFTVDGTQRVSVDFRLDIDGIEDQTVDLETFTFNASASMKLDQYQFKTTNMQYAPNKLMGAQFEFIKSNKTIVKVKVSVGDFSVSGLGGDISQEDTWDKIADEVTIDGGQAQITVDVLGELQINANFSDFQGIREALENLEDDEHDERAYKSDVKKLNSLMQAGLYYDRTSTLQANFLLKAFEEKDQSFNGSGYYEDRYWEIKPIIRFADGSTYSLLEESSFFNESSFQSLVDMAEDLFDEFEELLDL